MYIDVDGQRVFFSNGNGKHERDQPSVLFIHGAGMDHSVWVLPARYFARHKFNVIAPDLPGHGRSAGAALTSIEVMASWVAALLDALSITDSAIVGHSMGSLVALNFAACHPEKTRRLALLGVSTPMPVTEMLLDAAKANDHDAIDMANTWSHSPFGEMGGNENPGICMTMSGQRLLERTPEDVFFADLNACNQFQGGEALAEKINVPTLIIAGAQDKMTAPVNASKMAGLIEHSRLVTLNPCGHSMLSEQPNAVLDALALII